jgi:hypothetical protein
MREPSDSTIHQGLEKIAFLIEEFVVVLQDRRRKLLAFNELPAARIYAFVQDVRYRIGTIGLNAGGRHRRPAILSIHKNKLGELSGSHEMKIHLIEIHLFLFSVVHEPSEVT